ncbi:MAG TPA: amino acid permease [Bacteroidales bacterium]|nr:amino acid permease [Bacteroidales bacterium]HSA43217.1 amino acid permease [Bacteroidales bacterium]
MNTSAGGFRKSLNLFDSTSIVVGSMIGSGIFIVSADMSRTLGSPGWLMITWLISGLITVIAALSYGELAAMMPKAGGQYVYLREAYNPLSGFLYGWTLFLIIQTGTIAAVAMAFAKFAGVIFPAISETHLWLQVHNFRLSPAHGIAICSILFLTWLNSRGIKLGKIIQNAFTSSKVIILLAFILVGLFLARNEMAVSANRQVFWEAFGGTSGQGVPLWGWSLIAAMGAAMVGSLFSSDAWNNITFTAGEVINPRKNIPLSLLLGTLIVNVLYLVTNWVYLQALPLRGIADTGGVIERGMQFAVNDRLGTAAMEGLLGNYAAIVMACFVVISTFGCNNGLILSGARVYYAMAGDGLFFRKAGELNERGVPAKGLWIQALWASLLCLSGTYSNLLDYVIFAVLIFYSLTILGVFILRYKQPHTERPYKAFGYPLIPALYILIAMLIMSILLIYKPHYTWPGLIIVVLGIPVYFLWRKKAG